MHTICLPFFMKSILSPPPPTPQLPYTWKDKIKGAFLGTADLDLLVI